MMSSNQNSCDGRLSRRQVLLTAAAITGGAAMAVAIPGRHALGAVDGRTVNPMKLRLGQWLNFGKSDRGIFLRGFSVGWYRGLDPGSEAIRKQNPGPLLDSIDLQITKLANKPKNAQAPLVTVLSRVTILGWLPPLDLLGGEWTRFPMRHRILSIQALVAGAYSEAVWRKVGEPSDSATLSRKLSNARLIVRSPLPLNPNLMLARLNDFFADKEQLETPLSEAVMKVDTSAIRAVHRDGAPAADAIRAAQEAAKADSEEAEDD